MNNSTLARFVTLVAVIVVGAGLSLGLSACSDPATDGGTTATSAGSIDPGSEGAISVEEALAAAARDDSRPYLVAGYLFVYAGGDTKLSDVILESYPPQPGGATLNVKGLDPADYELTTEGDVSWADAPVEVLGTIDAGASVMTVSAASK